MAPGGYSMRKHRQTPLDKDPAYHEGKAACRRGDPQNANPYEAHSLSFTRWRIGWRVEDKQQRKGKI